AGPAPVAAARVAAVQAVGVVVSRVGPAVAADRAGRAPRHGFRRTTRQCSLWRMYSASTVSSPQPPSFLSPRGDRTLVEQIVDWYAARIDERVIRPGTRMPSVRQFAAGRGVSRFTVVEAYDRLIAR